MENRSEQISVFKHSLALRQNEPFMQKVRRKLAAKALELTVPALPPILCIVHLCYCVSITDCVMREKMTKRNKGVGGKE